jgi:hypothetical protein
MREPSSSRIFALAARGAGSLLRTRAAAQVRSQRASLATVRGTAYVVRKSHAPPHLPHVPDRIQLTYTGGKATPSLPNRTY